MEQPAPAPAPEPQYTFRWVEGVADATPDAPEATASVPVGGEEPEAEPTAPKKRATRKPAAKRATTTRSRSKATKTTEEEPVAAEAEAGSDTAP